MATSHLGRHDPSEVLTQRNGEVPVPCEKIQSRLNNLIINEIRFDTPSDPCPIYDWCERLHLTAIQLLRIQQKEMA
jgi:hypothetical protein